MSNPLPETATQTVPDTESVSSSDFDSSESTSTKPKLYPVVWRWHFYAGLLTSPILWMVTITGALYVFSTELSAWRDQELHQVVAQSDRLSYDRLKEIAAENAASDDLEALVVHDDPARSVAFVAHVEGEPNNRADDQHQWIYLNPYDGSLLGTRIAEHDFFAVVLKLHRNLMLGTTGRVLTELVTSWGLILLATGVYLWWPRGKKNVRLWLPRLKGKFYAVLRDWHAVSGIYLVPLIGIVAFTGLFFTQVWGSGFNTTAKKMGHWPPEWFQAGKVEVPADNPQPLTLNEIVPKFLAYSRSPEDAVAIRFSEKPDVAHKAFYMIDEDKNQLKTISVNPYTGEEFALINPADLPFLYRVRLWAVSIHMGKIFGMPTKILALIASLGLLGLSVTGLWMWWKRKPHGRSGFPRTPLPGSLPLWGWIVIAVCGILFPVAGISILAICLLDWICGLLFRQQNPA
ncbi:PepSY-associated TM helix domain-containing protein [Gimesia chilikensis]|uniref:PepSY-associated TM helix domain-containing protein n=1 Tax=Gimesia chilikensis TaxID=2605989 RepID=UPI00118C9C92|nr:PepSY domain-containing protein [Gimesia chilikensis]QDT85320.1 PepSY-associated TM helix [Gimesia chilikensis]